MTRPAYRLGSFPAACPNPLLLLAFVAVVVGTVAAPANALPVGEQAARMVALNTIREHVEVFGTWGGVRNPHIQLVEPIDLGADRLAFNVRVWPTGHVLVAADDELNPVLLYSDTHAFETMRAGDPDSFEGWIVPEIGHVFRKLQSAAAQRPHGVRPAEWASSHVPHAWNRLAVPESSFQPRRKKAPLPGQDALALAAPDAPASASATGGESDVVVGPIVTANWTQGSPYSNYTPADTGCTHTLSGCVAIATTQIMKYWKWPTVGTGSHSYAWNGQTLSANFAHTYNWSSMPDSLSGASAAQIDAVARLISDVGVAVEMDYGCGGSGAYTSWVATSVLPTYFSYTATSGSYARSNHTAAEFFAKIRSELDASPRRPVLFSVRTTDNASGHALVIDGYQTGSSDVVHLNLGWGGAYQGWYNIGVDWSSGYNWSASSEVIYPGIEPTSPRVSLSVTKAGSGTGVVTSTPAGLNCGTACSVPAETGSTVQLSAAASPGSHFVAWGGDCSASGTVQMSRESTCSATFDLDNPALLAEAVDNASLSLSTGGTAGWFSQTAVTHNGGDAAQSGPIGNSAVSYMQTTVVGPGTLSFWWKVSSESGYDFLTCYLDGVAQPGRISGDVGWTQVTITLASGTHTVKWQYSKDANVAGGSDAGWVDQVVASTASATLSVSKSGNGAGTVTSSVAGIDCGATCSAGVGLGTSVTLTANAASGSLFMGWGGPCSGRTSTCTVTTSAATSVSAVFQSSPYYRRYFAEGAVTDFFSTRFALLNPSSSVAHVTMRFLRDGDSSNVTYLLDVPAYTRRTVDGASVPGLNPAPGFSSVIESDVPVVADRTMSWNGTAYGAHSETAIEAPAQTWYLAEGSTLKLSPTVGFNLYYLVENPNDSAVNVTVTFLRPAPATAIVKSYTIQAQRRLTLWVNGEDPALASTDVSGVVSSTSPSLPIIVERALYLNTQGQTFGAGHDAAGVTATATDWFLAEGATGPIFDLYLLLANPNPSDAELDLTYQLPDGRTMLKHYQVPATSRRTVWVNGEQEGSLSLAQASVSTRVHSTNGVGVIVERAMWWPSPGWGSWYESHCSVGSTTTGTAWALADGEQGGARNTQTYILVANTSAYAGRARVTLMFEDGTSGSTEVAIPANSRTTVWTGGTQITADSPFGGLTAGKRFGVLVESVTVNGQTANIVVERSQYWDANGQWWGAGTNAVGTKLR